MKGLSGFWELWEFMHRKSWVPTGSPSGAMMLEDWGKPKVGRIKEQYRAKRNKKNKMARQSRKMNRQ